jgi:uncharacterized membrane protein YkvI
MQHLLAQLFILLIMTIIAVSDPFKSDEHTESFKQLKAAKQNRLDKLKIGNKF